MKKLTFEILIIVLISIAIAITYNFFSSKPLPWLRTEVKIETVDDSLLDFGTDTLLVSRNDSNSMKSQETNAKDSLMGKLKVEDSLSKPAAKPLEANDEKIDGKLEDGVKTLTFEQVSKHLKNPNFLFVDARPADEWQEAHIGAAVNILPPYDGDMEGYFKKLMALSKDKIIVVYCSGGTCESSHKVASDLIAFGYPKVFLYAGGWDEWAKRRGK